MDWFFNRFRRQNSGRAALVCYLRENGPIAYGTDVFGTDPRERIDAMLSTDLTWYWKTSAPSSLHGFSAAAQAPLHAVVSRPGPGGDLLFVAQQPPESIRTMLHAWGIDRDKAQRRPYARLHGTALEDLIRALSSA